MKTVQDAIKAIDVLHGKGVKTVVLSSGLLSDTGDLVGIASTNNGMNNHLFLQFKKCIYDVL